MHWDDWLYTKTNMKPEIKDNDVISEVYLKDNRWL